MISIILILLRVILLPFNSTLTKRVEISTPFTSFKRLQECIFLFNNGLDPHDGGICHQAPLLIPVITHIPPAFIPYLFILIDYIISILLVRIALVKVQSLAKEKWPLPKTVNKPGQDVFEFTGEFDDTKPDPIILDPKWVGYLYLMNPYAILACVGQSTGLFVNLATVYCIWFATRGKLNLSMLFLSIAVYLGLYPIVFLPVCVLLSKDKWWKGIFFFAIYETALFFASHYYMGSFNFIFSTYGVLITVSDLTPNIGLYWYFFIEVFESSRTFFISLFQFMVFIFIIPVTIRFHDHPLFVVYILATILAIFKPYPSISDTSMALAFLSIHPEILKYSVYKFIITNVILYASILGPLFFNLWIYANAGNANFFYAITLLWGLSHVMLLMDITNGFATREWERLNPEWRIARAEAVLK